LLKGEIITVGTEILMGQITNTNAAYISNELLKLGVGVYYHSVVGDNHKRLMEVLSCSLDRADIIVLTGGLGPTGDDITRETVAELLQLPLQKDQDWESRLEKFFSQRNRPMVESNRKQALVPRGGKLLPNEKGTAPGVYLEYKNNTVVLLPGPPEEMKHVFKKQVCPLLKDKLEFAGEKGVLLSRSLRIVGLGESAIEDKLQPWLNNQDNPTIAPLAKRAEVHLRITARSKTKDEAIKLIDDKEKEISGALGDYIYGRDEEELEHVVARLLWEKEKTLAVGESCSGGLLCHRLTNVPGSSGFLLAGMVTYSNEAKMNLLEVKKDTLLDKGAVSEAVALQMAQGSRRRTGADIGISITGIAGPSGGTPDKPVGLTYLALDTQGFSFCRKYQMWGEREDIKIRVSQVALNLLRLHLLGLIEQC